MKAFTILALLAALAAGPVAPVQMPEPVDTAAIARIRDEGLNRSQVMDTLFWLTDRYGPRLSGSPEYEEAGDWAMGRLREWGVQNLRKQRFASGPGWSLRNFHATMLEPRVMPMIGVPLAWTPGTSGTVRAEVVRPIITTSADAEKYRGQLRGTIVLTQPAREVRMLEHGDGPVVRYADQDGRWRHEAMTAPSSRRARGLAVVPPAFDVAAFYRDEGVVALFGRGRPTDLAPEGSGLSWVQQRPDGGTIFPQDTAFPDADPAALLPRVTLAVEHYNRMVRLLEHDVPVTVELNVDVRYTPETTERPGNFNLLGEIPGTDKADEIVLIGAHFDSWHAATGATDNAAGSAAMMEVLRILNATGLRPRRTIRIALWGDEENGLNGSAHYAREVLGTREAPTPDRDRFASYFNLDNGTGPIRGVWMQENPRVEPIFRAWAEPLADLGVEIFSPRSVTGTDHESFDELGLPAFQFVQERYEYNSRTHHSNMDFYDRVQADDLRQAATVAAVFVWHAATRDDVLPRRSAAR
jgi:hypothetical protein